MSLQVQAQSSGSISPQCIGQSSAIAQFGEIFQGIAADEDDALHRCLLSLPCPKLHSNARFTASYDDEVTVMPKEKAKARRAAELTLKRLGAQFAGGLLQIESNISEGKGMGSSTADCTATVWAVANALQRRLSPRETAELVVQAEVASGNIMFDRAVLFAHREGRILEQYLQPLPNMVILGIDTAPEQTVETLKFPPATYSSGEVEQFKVLTAALRRAITTQDVHLLGSVSTASANINQKFLPKPLFAEICRASHQVDALGVAVAHSGTVMSILFDSADPGVDAKAESAAKLLSQIGITDVLRFQN